MPFRRVCSDAATGPVGDGHLMAYLHTRPAGLPAQPWYYLFATYACVPALRTPVAPA
ncbi:hypothetical protein GCM10010222_65460 [Streptomyces tanashiensis]|nr:hypothetical protein GCM10010222_65460 [Streptomyces tanashiensis]